MRLVPKLLLHSFTFTGLVQLVTASGGTIAVPLKQSSNSKISKIDLVKSDTFIPPMGIEVQIGKPPKTYNLLFDTGYSDTFVFAQSCTKSDGCPSVTENYKTDSSEVSHYGYQSEPLASKTTITGNYYGDIFEQIGGSPVPTTTQTFVVVSKISNSALSKQKKSSGSSVAMDGIFGVGPRDGTVDHRFDGAPVYDTPVMSFLNGQSMLNSFSLSFTNGKGNVVFGVGPVEKGVDYLGSTPSSGGIDTWAVQLSLFYYANSVMGLNGAPSNTLITANISSGTTYTYLDNGLVNQLAVAMDTNTIAELDTTTGLTKYLADCKLKSNLQTLKILIDSKFNVSLTVGDLIIGPDKNKKCIFSIVGTKGGSVLGYHFMKFFTTTFNYSNLGIDFSNA